jgi:hypothetical protein
LRTHADDEVRPVFVSWSQPAALKTVIPTSPRIFALNAFIQRIRAMENK